MDDRLRGVEKDVVDLQGWRTTTVDPWISSGKEFRTTVGTYITTLKAQEELKEKLNDERHRTNSFKLNYILALATIGLLVIAIASLFVSYLAVKHSMVFPLNLHSATHQLETARFAGGIGNAHF